MGEDISVCPITLLPRAEVAFAVDVDSARDIFYDAASLQKWIYDMERRQMIPVFPHNKEVIPHAFLTRMRTICRSIDVIRNNNHLVLTRHDDETGKVLYDAYGCIRYSFEYDHGNVELCCDQQGYVVNLTSGWMTLDKHILPWKQTSVCVVRMMIMPPSFGQLRDQGRRPF